MIATQNLAFAYTPEQPFAFPDLNFEQGAHGLILGQSGCGKSTLLHLLGGLRRAQKGTVSVAGKAFDQMSETQLDRFRGQHIGIIFQQAHLIKALTVEENLLAAHYLAGNKQDKQLVRSTLEKLNMGHKLKSKPQNLSLGEQQRVAIARAIMNKPSLILADEPTSSLDDNNCAEVLKLLLEQSAESNATLLIVTHDGRLKTEFEQKILL